MAEEFQGAAPTPTMTVPPQQPPVQPPVQPAGGAGLAPNVAGALCYLLGLITGIVFLLIEKENRFVRFHALQSIFVAVALIIANIILGFIPILGWLVGMLLSVLGLVLWIVLMVKAYQGQEWEVPVLGKMAHEQVAKMG